MKKIYVIVSLCFFILNSCTTGSKAVHTQPDSFTMKEGEQKNFGSTLITVKEVKDSRCPKNVNCIRAGEAIAVLNVLIANSSERNIQLCAGADCSARGLSENYSLHTNNGQKYLFTLDSIAPYPMSGVEQKDKKVFFTIKQLE